MPTQLRARQREISRLEMKKAARLAIAGFYKAKTFSILYWSNYTAGTTKLVRKSEVAVQSKHVLKLKRKGGLSVCLNDAKAAKEFRDLHERCINFIISKTSNITKATETTQKTNIGRKKNKPSKRPKRQTKRPELAKNNRG